MSLQPRYHKGDKIGGRYLVHQALTGGMGEVYLCLDLEQNEPYALKTFQQRYLANPRIRQLFAHEVGTWIALEKHPNIVRCFYMDTLDNQPFMLLEWVVGEEGKGADLRSWLRQGPLDLRTALDFTIDICRGLIHAQAKQPGIVHRDLKPENILVGQGRPAKITDFGLATLVQHARLELAAEETAGSRWQTMSGASGVVGTPPYMAPEQLRGEAGDVRSDIYAVGCILYELLTGSLPYQATTLDGWQRLHITAVLPVIPVTDKLPGSLNKLLARLLAKAPDDRFANASVLLDTLILLYQEELAHEPRSMAVVDTLTAVDYLNRGLTYAQLKRYHNALSDFDRAIELDPTSAQVYYNRGRMSVDLGRYSDALADLSRAIQHDPAYTKAYNNRGITYQKLGHVELALADFDHAITLDLIHAKAYLNRGSTYAELGRVEAALLDYDRAIELDPTLAMAYSNRGKLYADLGRRDQALTDFTRAIQLDPAFAQAYAYSGATYNELGHFDEALDNLTRAIQLDPTLALAFANRGATYAQLGRTNEALADFNRAISLDISISRAFAGRGAIFGQLGRYHVSLADLDRAIHLDPSDAYVYVNRGLTCAQLGSYDAALTDYDRAIELNPNLAMAYFNRGMLLANQGKLRPALTDFDRAVQFGFAQGEQYVVRLRQMLGLLPADEGNPAQQAFEALERTTSRVEMQRAVSQFPFMTDLEFINAVEHVIEEQVPPEQHPGFKERLTWLRELASEQR